ncbi:hypothetical protein BJX66DRAFT_332371 [Aspergillus keveii]|uniref:Uncharacterized protein n=1 Tax=Aspergillus keveii TaxID=714993 RepID=A0ABR4GMD5_9EURO
MSYLDEPPSGSSTPFDPLGFTPPPSLLDQKLSGSSILSDTLSFTPPPSLPTAITMKRTTAVHDPDITHILSKHYDTVTRFKDKKYRLGISKARPNDKKAIITGFPYIKAAKEHKAEKLWRCIETTTEHELAKSIARIHEARRLAGKKNDEIWGIATDCEKWTFAYIDDKNRCSYHRLTWSSHKNQVVFHIMRILNETMNRATKIVKSIRPSRAAVWRQKVKRYTGDNEIHPSGLRIVDRKRGRIYSRRDDFSGRLLDFEYD